MACSSGLAYGEESSSSWIFPRPFAQGIIGGPTGRKGGGVARFFRGPADGVCGRVCGCVRVARVVIYPASYAPCGRSPGPCVWPVYGLMIPCERTVSRRTGAQHTISRCGRRADRWRTGGGRSADDLRTERGRQDGSAPPDDGRRTLDAWAISPSFRPL